MFKKNVRSNAMRQGIILLITWTTLFCSCSNDSEKREMKSIHQLNLELLTNSIRKKGLLIERARMNDPRKMESFYAKWQLIDSLASKIDMYLADDSTQTTASEFYNTTLAEVQELRGNYFEQIDSNWSKEDERLRFGFDAVMAKRMHFLTREEIEHSSFSKQYACSSLLLNLRVLANEIDRNTAFISCGWGIPWNTFGAVQGDTTTVHISSQHFHEVIPNGFFKIDQLLNAKRQVVRDFKSQRNPTVWTLKFSGEQDSVYFMSGSIFATHPQTNEIVEVDTFMNKKIEITGGYNTDIQ